MTLVVLPAHLAALQTATPVVWAPLLTKTIADNSIGKPLDFLANVLKESGRLRTLRESLNYSGPALLAQWPDHFSPEQASQFGRAGSPSAPQRPANQWQIAELAYGGRMGNRPAGAGDGWNFRGAGCLQTTGREGVQAFAKATGWTGSLEALADKLAEPAFAAASAGMFWSANGCDGLPTPTAIRIRINGGTNGLSDVLALRTEIARVFGFPTGQPVPIPTLRTSTADRSADALNALSLQHARMS